MTYEDVKAIRKNPTAEVCDLKELQRLINEAIEKQIPKKVIKSIIHGYGHCPICGRIYWDKCHVGNYCDQCGQRLEESENG